MMSWSTAAVKAAYQCNPEVIKFFRVQRGWTQAEFGRIAGYSERLISKAESGRSISSESIADLADALSTPERPLFPEDLISDPVQRSRQFIGAMYIAQKDIMSVIEPFLDHEVEFYVVGDKAQIPFAGTWKGIEGVAQLYELFYSVIEVPEEHDHTPHYNYICQGNDVVAWGLSWMHPIGQPLISPMPMSNLIRFRRGKIYYLEDRFDTKLAEQTIAASLEQRQNNAPHNAD